ncbi:MAG: hypothetical protein KC609_21830 [Myxococcales bacterium]|nr:hypothetical protein [Myxococcales bacterium]
MLGMHELTVARSRWRAKDSNLRGLGDVAPARRVVPLLVLRLEGTQAEMGAQHGEWLRRNGGYHQVIEFYPTMAQRLLRASFPHGKLAPALRVILDRACDWALNELEKRRPTEYRARGQAFVEALGEPGMRPEHLHVMDMFQNLIGYAAKLRLSPIARRFGPQIAPACSSIAVWGDASSDAELRHARNFDFPGIGVWDVAPTVVFCKPDKGLRYGFVTTRGADVPAVSGFNEAGISFTTHTRLHRDVNFHGQTICDLGHEIIQYAETLEDAVRIVRRRPVASSWGILVSSAREKRALVVETTGVACPVVEPSPGADFMICTNRYRSAHNLHREVTTTPAWIVNSDSREQILTDAARAASGADGLAADDLERLLAGHRPPSNGAALVANGEERATGAVLAQAVNVHAVVIEPESERVRVAVGTTPSSWGPYLSVPFDWDAPTGAEELRTGPADGGDAERGPTIHAPNFDNGDTGRAYAHFREALRLVTADADLPGARAQIERAALLAPDDPTYRFLAGAMQLQHGEFARALSHFEHGLRVEEHPFYRGNMLLWGSRAASAAGFPARAAVLREELAATSDELLAEHRRAATREGRLPLAAEKLRKTVVNFLLVDAVAH